MKTGRPFLDRLIDRMDDTDDSTDVQSYVLRRLVREKEFLETVFHTIREGVLVIDQGLHIRFANTAAHQLLGINENIENQRIDRYLRDIDWDASTNGGEKGWRLLARREIEIFYPVHRYLSFYLVPIETKSKEGESSASTAALFLQDVTASRQQTEKQVESERVQAITLLAAGVAHELGNPLNSLNIHLQLLGRTFAEIDDQELADEASALLGVAEREVQRLDGIVRNFLQAIRPVPPDLKPLDLVFTLKETLGFLTQEIEERGIVIKTELPGGLPMVLGDADQLHQAFFNLLRNAIQAMTEGGVLQVSCKHREDFIDVRFTDNGCGINQEVLGRVLDPYFTTKSEGSGLGLLIVERIVRDHGGELGIESRENEGSSFIISLPLRNRRLRLINAPSATTDSPES